MASAWRAAPQRRRSARSFATSVCGAPSRALASQPSSSSTDLPSNAGKPPSKTSSGASSPPGATPREFLSACDRLTANGDFTGVYVIHNTTRNLYYVGQSVRVVGRVTQHLTGHGNGDVYADLKYGDAFEISVVSLTQSGYESLDALERDAIDAFDAYGRGYNRTRGNRN